MCQHTNERLPIGKNYEVVVVDGKQLMLGVVTAAEKDIFKLIFLQPPLSLYGGHTVYGKQIKSFSLADFHGNNYFFRPVAIGATPVWN